MLIFASERLCSLSRVVVMEVPSATPATRQVIAEDVDGAEGRGDLPDAGAVDDDVRSTVKLRVFPRPPSVLLSEVAATGGSWSWSWCRKETIRQRSKQLELVAMAGDRSVACFFGVGTSAWHL